MMEKLLSIVIPTYNRSDLIKESLDSLYVQIEQYKQFIEIIISDNCSTDNTQEIISHYNFRDVDSRYFRQNSNIGFEANFDFLVDHSCGKYIYIMGDDDILSIDFLNVIFRYFKRGIDYSIIHWNRLQGDSKCQNNKLYDVEYKGFEREVNSSDFIKDRMTDPNFISSLIFSRKCWEQGKKVDCSKFYGYQWFGRIYHGAIVSNDLCLYYSLPLVIQRGGSHAWAKDYPIYVTVGLSNIFYSLDNKCSGLYKQWIDLLHQKYNLKLILISFSEHQNYYKKYEQEITQHLTSKERRRMSFWLTVKCPRLIRFLYIALYFK